MVHLNEANATAPGDLELVRAFVNTLDVEERTDDFATPSSMAAWLAGNDLLRPGDTLSEADRERAVELRESLREALLAHNGEALPDHTVDRLNEALAGVSLQVRFTPDCTIDLDAGGEGLDAALGRIASVVREATLSGEWARLKVCPADDCLWAFYDRSRNRSRTWCDMGVCGNRAKVRTFRERGSN